MLSRFSLSDNVAAKAILLTCAGYLCFSIGDMLVKSLSSDFSVVQIYFTVATLSACLLLVRGLVRRGPSAFVSTKLHWHVTRGIFGIISSGAAYYSFSQITLAEFYTIIFTAPFWVVILSVLVLKEQVTKPRIIAMVIGFAAVVAMFVPAAGLSLSIGVWMAMLSAFTYSCSMIIVRRLGATESKYLLMLVPNMLGALLTLPFAMDVFVTPTLAQFALFIVVSLIGVSGFFLVISGMHLAAAPSQVAPFHYTQLIYGIVLGYLVFGDVPSGSIIAGGSVIALTGIYLTLNETRKARIVVDPPSP